MNEAGILKVNSAGLSDLKDCFLSLRNGWRNGESRTPVAFALSSLSVSLSHIISSMVIARYIEPKDLGLWQSVNLALTYGMLLLAGVQNGLSRELPYHLGAREENSAKRLASTTLLYTTGACRLAMLCGVASVTFFSFKHADTNLSFAIAAVTLLIVFQFYRNYLFVTFRSHDSFLALSRVQASEAILAILTLPLLYFLRYEGMLLRIVFVTGMVVYLMHRARPVVVPPSWSKDSFMLLLKTGMPIFVLDYVRTCASTLDRVALLRFGGVQHVGLYSLALSAYSAFQVIPMSISQYVYPRMTYRYGQTGNPRLLWHIAWKATVLALAIMTGVACIGWFLLPPVVPLLFPKYVAATRAAQIMLFTAAASGAAVGANALLSMKAWSHISAYQLSRSVLLAIGPFVGIRLFSSSITGVACGMLAAHLLGIGLSLGITFAASRRQAIQHLTPEPLGTRSATKSAGV